MSKFFKCVCYLKKHEIGETTAQGKFLVNIIEELGEDIKVTSTLSGKTYWIPRIYIAAHGLRGDKIDYEALDYKFKEVVK